MSEVVSLETPVAWSRNRIWASKRRGFIAFVGFAPTFFALGIELITRDAKGLSVYIGPFWLAFAAIPRSLDPLSIAEKGV